MNIKRKIKKELKKMPMKSFNEWYEEHKYVLPKQSVKRHKMFPKWLLAPVSFILVVLVVLPIALSGIWTNGDNPLGEPPVLPPIIDEVVAFGENDIKPIAISTGYFDMKMKLLLIDLNKIDNEPIVIKEVPLNFLNLDISYIFKDAIIPFRYKDNPFALKMTYRIKIYEHYIFSEKRFYEELIDNITIGEYEMEYTIHNMNYSNECNLYFKHGGNEYYLHIKEAMPHWELNADSLQAFLQYLFSSTNFK